MSAPAQNASALALPDLSGDGAKPGLPAPLGDGLRASQKAALVLAALGPDLAGPIIERIDEKHLRAFAKAYAQMQKIPQSALTAVAQEFVGNLSSEDSGFIEGGFDATRDLLGNFLDSDNMMRLMDEIDAPGAQSVWEKMERVSDDKLIEYISTQNPQLVAVILSRINVETASRLLDLMDTELAGDVVLRLTRPMDVKPHILRILEDTIERDFLAPMRKVVEKDRPGEMVGAMMNNVASKKREALLGVLTAQAPDVMTDVRKSMLTFDDLATRAPANAMPMVIKELEEDVFLKATKYGQENAPDCVEFIFANISQRMAQQYKEQMEEMKDFSTEEGEAAQAAFMSVLRKLVKQGEVELNEIEEETPEGEEGEEGDGEEKAA